MCIMQQLPSPNHAPLSTTLVRIGQLLELYADIILGRKVSFVKNVGSLLRESLTNKTYLTKPPNNDCELLARSRLDKS